VGSGREHTMVMHNKTETWNPGINISDLFKSARFHQSNICSNLCYLILYIK
jgi:hypothetical protein